MNERASEVKLRPDDPEYRRLWRAARSGRRSKVFNPEIRAKVIAALKAGPGTTKTICERACLPYDTYWRSQIGHALRWFQRYGLVQPINEAPDMGHRKRILWSLCAGVCE